MTDARTERLAELEANTNRTPQEEAVRVALVELKAKLEALAAAAPEEAVVAEAQAAVDTAEAAYTAAEAALTVETPVEEVAEVQPEGEVVVETIETETTE